MALNWNWDEIKESNFELLPDGDYDTVITSAEEKDTKAGGKYWNVRFQVCSGEHSGQGVFSNFNIENTNPKTEKWARSDIKAICMQNGKEMIDEIGELISMSAHIRVGSVTNDKYGEQNTVRILRSGEEKPTKVGKINLTKADMVTCPF